MILRKFYVALYAFGCILLPPIHFHHKTLFLSELLLLPLIPPALLHLFKRTPPLLPKILICVAAACVAALLAGLKRGDVGINLSAYQNLTEGYTGLRDDTFNWAKDGVAFARWLIIFSTPWILAAVFTGKRYLPTFFWTTVKYAVCLSAGMAVLDHLHFISLVNLGYHDSTPFWSDRSFGTQPSPLEGSLIYGCMIVYLVSECMELKWRVSVALIAATKIFLAGICLYALYLTGTGTAMVALGLALFSLGLDRRKPYKARLFLLCALILVFVGGVAIVPPSFLKAKLGDFAYRSTTWVKFASLLSHKPWLLLTGIGFSGVVVDNSIILLLIKGGLFLLISVGAWVKKLYAFIPSQYSSIFVFWAFTWLALDSVGYWALGRALWFLLGLLYSSEILAIDSAERTRNSAPRGSIAP